MGKRRIDPDWGALVMGMLLMFSATALIRACEPAQARAEYTTVVQLRAIERELQGIRREMATQTRLFERIARELERD